MGENPLEIEEENWVRSLRGQSRACLGIKAGFASKFWFTYADPILLCVSGIASILCEIDVHLPTLHES